MAIDYFGAGVLYAVPLFTAAGAAIPVATRSPVQFGIVQGVEIEDEAETKELYGANQYPVDIGRGKAKLSIKCEQAQFSAQLFNTIYYGQTLVAGYSALLADSVGTALGGTAVGTSVVITPTAPYGGTSVFASDLGVQDGNGVPFTRVASSPTSGQYSVTGQATGATYQFSGVDVGTTVFISYSYTNATNPAGGDNLVIYNIPMGQVPVFQAQFFNSRNGQTIWRRFRRCVGTKLSMSFKNDDFVIPNFEMSCFADENNIVQDLGFSS